MNSLLVLLDKTNLMSKKEGFIITKKDFDLYGTNIDLGFRHRQKSYQDKQFYSIPILDYPYCPKDAEILNDIAQTYFLTNRKRFFFRTEKNPNPGLGEVNNNIVESVEYHGIDFKALLKRDYKLGEKIKRVDKIFTFLNCNDLDKNNH